MFENLYLLAYIVNAVPICFVSGTFLYFWQINKSFFFQCELEVCIGKRRGYVASDGTIDKQAFEADVAENFKQRPELVKNIKNNCINADVNEYGPEDFCELMKISHCIHVQIALVNMMWTWDIKKKKMISGHIKNLKLGRITDMIADKSIHKSLTLKLEWNTI